MDSEFILNHPEELYTVLLETSVICLVVFAFLFYLEKTEKKSKPLLKQSRGSKKSRRNKRK